MRFSKTFSQNFLLLIISIVISILLIEWVVGKIFFTPAAASIALEEGIDFDTRSRLEVVLDCRKSDKSCYPAVPPHTFLTNKLEVAGERIVPLSGVARARIIACNEGGFYSTYTTDEYGFRNPAGIWRNADIVDLAFVGDSYTQGDCVNDGDHFVDHFRPMFPKVLNLGAGGNGPLLELASVKEYLEGKQVRYLFWIYFERNDFSDLKNRKQSPVLLQYLKPGFSQSLMSRHKEINEALRIYIDNRLKMKEQGRAKVLPNLRLLLWKLRHDKLPTAYSENKGSSDVADYDIELFGQVLEETKRIIMGSGGKLVFVYLPEYERFSENTPSPPWSAARIKPDIIDMVSALGIDVIDIEPAFHREDDPLELFPFRIQGHYNSKGYAVVANEIKRYLDDHQI
jgi:hypothetical protein